MIVHYWNIFYGIDKAKQTRGLFLMQVSKEYLKTHQYQNENNLVMRRKLFQYGINPEPLWRWVAKQYTITKNAKILEVGCGNGDFWQEASKVFPKNCFVTLTDFSAGMLERAKYHLRDAISCHFEVADVEYLPYAAETFDVIFAHLMLYHAARPKYGLLEIRRVMKPTGFAGILVSAESNMSELFQLLNCKSPRQANCFSAEVAMEVLPDYFSSIRHHVYQDIIKISEVEPIIDYLRSFSKMKQNREEFYVNCRSILLDYFKNNGFLSLSISRHLFIVSLDHG
jgi:ubiquinone/menaquinone biosynthesis C-methylase UbiE